MKYLLSSLFCLSQFLSNVSAQYWQQKAEYIMQIEMDVNTHRFKGHQQITYTNNSPDTLKEVFYHLYYNAFQPGSMMDQRSQNITDPDRRISDRISKLNEDEIGYHKIQKLEQDGSEIHFHEYGTILKVFLNTPLPPGGVTSLEMEFESQVPVQIRRTGRNNIEGIDYSMSQWYPKLAEYDMDGWNAIPYIAREYHGVWGDFDITILIDSTYTLAATGILQDPEKIGKGYAEKTTSDESALLSWHFVAKNVHDFVWTADPDYIHTVHKTKDNIDLHFFYQNDSSIIENWELLPSYTAECFRIMGKLVGKYPYSSYSVIQGGDGGMEYPMATLILGNGKTRGLIGVMVHEVIHSWFQGVLANNEGKYPWMDEGFNTYYNHLVIDSIYGLNQKFPHQGSYSSYFNVQSKGLYEPLSTHADHYRTNKAYGVAAYSMGCIFLNQLTYVIGRDVLHRSIQTYYDQWKFKHPEPRDLKRILESESGIRLDWYFNNFIYTTRTVDYSIESVDKSKGKSIINLKNKSDFPMPVDVSVLIKDGRTFHYNIPLRIMYGNKCDDGNLSFIQSEDWLWTVTDYRLTVDFPKKEIEKVVIDAFLRSTDINPSNNYYPKEN